MKKVVVFGGGTGLSYLLKGLKLFPIDIVAIVSVADDGKSTGKLREEFNIPAVGDLRNVVVALSETEPLVEQLFQYRFVTNGDLNGHSIGNLLLTALFNINGSLTDAVSSFGKILNLKGKVLPLTEDTVTFVAHTTENEKIIGESKITKAYKTIKKIEYMRKPKILDAVLDEINDADLIVFSMGSLYTSILPHLLCDELVKALNKSEAKKMYVCNTMTQHGETDGYKASDHLKLLSKYTKKNIFDAIIVNSKEVEEEIKKRYMDLEKAEPVIADYDKLKKMNIEIIKEDLAVTVDNMVRHDSLKLGYLIFSYLMK